jgi:predicted  nucleic acid-binding Zn-ribbon protein
VTTPSEELDPKDIELFGLRREVDRLRPALSAADNENARLREEIERLREDIVELARTFNAENERLRKANGVLGQQLSKAFGDIEHLQEAYRIEQETHRRTASERDAALAEVERWEGGE